MSTARNIGFVRARSINYDALFGMLAPHLPKPGAAVKWAGSAKRVAAASGTAGKQRAAGAGVKKTPVKGPKAAAIAELDVDEPEDAPPTPKPVKKRGRAAAAVKKTPSRGGAGGEPIDESSDDDDVIEAKKPLKRGRGAAGAKVSASRSPAHRDVASPAPAKPAKRAAKAAPTAAKDAEEEKPTPARSLRRK